MPICLGPIAANWRPEACLPQIVRAWSVSFGLVCSGGGVAGTNSGEEDERKNVGAARTPHTVVEGHGPAPCQVSISIVYHLYVGAEPEPSHRSFSHSVTAERPT